MSPEASLRTRRQGILAERQNGRWTVDGEDEWLVSGLSKEERAEVAEALSGLAEPIGDVLLLSFGNAVGYFDAPYLGRIEVRSQKCSRQVFDRMLAELTAVASRLPFAATTSAGLPYDRSVVVQKSVLYHLFVYLRQIFDTDDREEQIQPNLQAILADPHRRLTRERHSVELTLARRVDAGTLEAIVSGRSPLTRADARIQRRASGLRALGGLMPERVEESRCRNSLDTAENRFVKTFLAMAAGVFEQMAEVCEKRGPKSAFVLRTHEDARRLGREISFYRRSPLWREVGPMIHFPASSTVLQRRRGYREVFRHAAKLRLAARVPLGEEVTQRLLDARDIAELYELWCFFRLVAEVESLLGPPNRAFSPQVDETGLKVSPSIGVRWGQATLWYNRTYHSSAKPPKPRSYSVALRPDISLELSESQDPRLHLFDAKFRFDPPLKSGGSQDQIEADERAGRFKRADLYKMHAYRDAIGAGSVWVLYPGTEVAFFPRRGPAWKGLGPFPADLAGVGAIPLAPPGVPDRPAPLTREAANPLARTLQLLLKAPGQDSRPQEETLTT